MYTVKTFLKTIIFCFQIIIIITLFNCTIFAYQIVSIDGVKNCASIIDYRAENLEGVELPAGEYTFILDAVNFPFGSNGDLPIGGGGMTPPVYIDLNVDNEFRIFSLNGIGDSQKVSLHGQPIYIGYIDNFCFDNDGSGTVSIKTDDETIDANVHCILGDPANTIYKKIEFEPGEYTFTLTESDFSFGDDKIVPWINIITGMYNEFYSFTLNGTGDTKTITIDSKRSIYFGFYDTTIDDNKGSTTVLIQSEGDSENNSNDNQDSGDGESTGGENGGDSSGGGTDLSKGCSNNEDCAEDEVCNTEINVCVACLSDNDCSDGIFCNGEERCIDNQCQEGILPCNKNEVCDEDKNICVSSVDDSECSLDEECNDGLFCNGQEQCIDGKCFGGNVPCSEGQLCKEEYKECWEVQNIHARLLKKIFYKPLLNKRRDRWLSLFCNEENHVFQGSIVTIQGPDSNSNGITVNQNKQVKINKIKEKGTYIFIPICIENTASTGQWIVQIKTEVNDMIEENVEAIFEIKVW